MTRSSHPRRAASADNRGSTASGQGSADAPGDDEDTPEADVPRERPRLKRRSVLLRIVGGVAVLFTAWHVLASFLWIAPAGPAREAVPAKALSAYMLPLFGQSWSVFAPEPVNGDNRMFVRAVVKGDDGDDTVTEWLNVTAVESQLLTHHLFPARAGNQSIDLASDYRSAYQKLDKAQQHTVALNYFKESWTTRLGAELRKQKAAGVSGYLDADFRAVRYSTQVARAVWGEGVQRVQFRMERQNVVPFDQRNDPDAKRPAVQLTPSGWRGVQQATGQSDEDFARTFRALYEDYRRSER